MKCNKTTTAWGWRFVVGLNITFLAAASGAITQPMIQLTTSQEGMHRVTAAALAQLTGQSTNLVSQQLRQGAYGLWHQGQPVGWLPGSEGQELHFYAQARHTVYGDQNVYCLTAGTNATMAAMDGAAPAAQPDGVFLASTNVERDLTCRYDLGTRPDSNYWYWATLAGGNRLLGKFNAAFSLSGNGPTNRAALLNVRVAGVSTGGHSLSLSVNGNSNAAWAGSWTGNIATNFTFTLPAAVLQDGSNSVVFTATGNLDQWLLDGFQIQYPQAYLAAQGRLVCTADSNHVVTVAGFTNAAITVLDVTDPQAPLLVTNLNVEGGSGAWRASFSPRQSNARYAVSEAGAEFDVAGMQAVAPADLLNASNRAALLIIAPTNLLTAAQPLADYRNHQGLETRVVSLEDVYSIFNGGLREPEAIRTFLAYAWQNWAVRPAYVLLAGKGTYDYRNLLGAGDNLVPPLMVSSIFGLVASDSDYGKVMAGPGPQMAVGRLPVTNALQLASLIAKIQNYEAAPPRRRTALLLADLADPATGDFPAEIACAQNLLGQTFQTQSILPANTASNTATMRSQWLAGLNAGADYCSYFGHGAAQQLGNSGYLTAADVAALTATNPLPLVATMSCLCGFYGQPGCSCLAETLTLAGRSGAIGMFSASGLSMYNDASRLDQALAGALASGTPGRVGDFIRQALTSYNQQTGFTVSGMFNLMGDPALLYRGAALPAPVAPQVSALAKNNDGTMAVTLTAQPGQTYILAATTNLALPFAAWPVVSTGTVPFGPFVLNDLATNQPQRFYRLSTGP
ncbi:MAG: C25 family cysteine peptidase [Verrucomicrobiota bacterium]